MRRAEKSPALHVSSKLTASSHIARRHSQASSTCCKPIARATRSRLEPRPIKHVTTEETAVLWIEYGFLKPERSGTCSDERLGRVERDGRVKRV